MLIRKAIDKATHDFAEDASETHLGSEGLYTWSVGVTVHAERVESYRLWFGGKVWFV